LHVDTRHLVRSHIGPRGWFRRLFFFLYICTYGNISTTATSGPLGNLHSVYAMHHTFPPRINTTSISECVWQLVESAAEKQIGADGERMSPSVHDGAVEKRTSKKKSKALQKRLISLQPVACRPS